MTPSELLDLFHSLGGTYDLAVRRLDCRDLRTFLLHESHWLRHAAADRRMKNDDLHQLRVRQAADYLKTLLEVTGKSPRRRRRRTNIVPLH